MQIQIPQDDSERLVRHAAAAGYDDVERYVTELVLAQAHQPTSDELPPLSNDEMQASLSLISRSEEDIAARRTRDLRGALQEIADRHGLSIPT